MNSAPFSSSTGVSSARLGMCRGDLNLLASPALAYPAGGRTKTLTLTEQEAVEVATALARYAQAKADLDAQAAAGLTVLLARVAARRAARR